MVNEGKSNRLELVDALRGSALFGILMLHSIELFGIHGFSSVDGLSRRDWLVIKATTALFAGKAYAIFALLFGLSFFLYLDAGQRRGQDVRKRFVWRLCLLGVIGYLHSILYAGDILLILAALGLPLVLMWRLSQRVLLALAGVLLLQPDLLVSLLRTAFGHVGPSIPLYAGAIAAQIERFKFGSAWQVAYANAGVGQLGRLLYTVETGRLVQMAGLFLVGLALGRSRILEQPKRVTTAAGRALVGGLICYGVTHASLMLVGHLGIPEYTSQVLVSLLQKYAALSQAAIWFGAFVFLFQRPRLCSAMPWLAAYGRMSLTNYVLQAAFWVPALYGFGFGLYRYLTPALAVGAAIPFFGCQCVGSRWWLAQCNFGPLEWVWRVATLRSWSVPMRRAPRAPRAVAMTECQC